jgi:hypothetical protein
MSVFGDIPVKDQHWISRRQQELRPLSISTILWCASCVRRVEVHSPFLLSPRFTSPASELIDSRGSCAAVYIVM